MRRALTKVLQRIVSDLQNQAVNQAIITSDQSIKTCVFRFGRRLSFLIRTLRLSAQYTAAPAGGYFHLWGVLSLSPHSYGNGGTTFRGKAAAELCRRGCWGNQGREDGDCCHVRKF